MPVPYLLYVDVRPGLTDLYGVMHAGRNAVNATTGGLVLRTDAAWPTLGIDLSDGVTACHYEADGPSPVVRFDYDLLVYQSTSPGVKNAADVNVGSGQIIWFDTRAIGLTDIYAATALTGTGDTVVDEDTGGTDNLRYVDGAIGVDDGLVRAYLRTEYDAGIFTTVRGRTYTKPDGRWLFPMNINGGFDYAMVFTKPGVYGPSLKYITLP